MRQGIMYRGGEFDGHQHISSPEGLEVLRKDLFLRTDLDIRGALEIEKGMPAYPLEPIGVRLIHMPMPGAAQTTLEHQKGVAEIFHILANPAIYPLYVHCWGGADRTGEIVLLLQALMGVTDEDLLTDYEMTSFGCWGPRSRNSPAFANIKAGLDAFGDDKTPMAVKAEAFLKAGGLSQLDIDILRGIFLKKL